MEFPLPLDTQDKANIYSFGRQLFVILRVQYGFLASMVSSLRCNSPGDGAEN